MSPAQVAEREAEARTARSDRVIAYALFRSEVQDARALFEHALTMVREPEVGSILETLPFARAAASSSAALPES